MQLVHSMILSHLDFSNSLLYGLPDVLLNKLKRVLYTAVRFIFNIKRRDKHHLSLYLKHLHLLPVKYHIQFQIALLTYKCVNGLAPKYMKDLLVLKKPTNNYDFQNCLDNTLLIPLENLKFLKSKAILQYSAPKVWNILPADIRKSKTLNQFKSTFKRNYFHLAFDVPNLVLD